MAGSKTGSAKRFGTRYGRSLRERVGKIEAIQRRKQLCPSCQYTKVKRVASGIWECRKCGAKFTGRAYSVSPKYRREVQ
ncbi:MAG: 50S ribosomal protein L37ae [Nanoarchaeota archaeon]